MTHNVTLPITEVAIEEWLTLLSHLPPFNNAQSLYDTSTSSGAARLHNLRCYLHLLAAARPKLILVGEAPGYRGTARTGIPFVSPSMLAGGAPGVVNFFANERLLPGDDGPAKPAEVTSAAVWRVLLKAPGMPLLWAVYPHHPHQPGDERTNRTPTRDEIAAGEEPLRKLIELFEIEQVVAVGNVAETVLSKLGFAVFKVRHPAHGGTRLFEQQMIALLSSA